MIEMIHIERKALSDGSLVFNVRIGTVVMEAVTEKDAQELAIKIQHAVHDHTTSSVSINHTY